MFILANYDFVKNGIRQTTIRGNHDLQSLEFTKPD